MPQYNPPPDSWHAIKQLYSNCFFRKYNELNLTWWFISITSYWFPVIIPPSCSVWDTHPHFSAGYLKYIDFEGLNFKRHCLFFLKICLFQNILCCDFLSGMDWFDSKSCFIRNNMLGSLTSYFNSFPSDWSLIFVLSTHSFLTLSFLVLPPTFLK